MADDDQTYPWSDQTELFINEIDDTLSKSNLSLRDLMLNPDKYANNKDTSSQIKSMKSAIDTYFDNLEESMADEKETFEKDLATKDELYNRIDEVISSKSALARVPYIKPSFLDIDNDRAEQIMVDEYNGSVDALLVKLINASTYAANISGSYNKHMLGSWVFSGNKTYVVTITPPSSPIMVMEDSRAEINNLVSVISDGLGVSDKKAK